MSPILQRYCATPVASGATWSGLAMLAVSPLSVGPISIYQAAIAARRVTSATTPNLGPGKNHPFLSTDSFGFGRSLFVSFSCRCSSLCKLNYMYKSLRTIGRAHSQASQLGSSMPPSSVHWHLALDTIANQTNWRESLLASLNQTPESLHKPFIALVRIDFIQFTSFI